MLNYINTIIYKIVCLDIKITDVYVGSTTDFNKRKNEHKTGCYNENRPDYNRKIYQIIRVNGGIDNWEMIKIEDYPCDNLEQARERERYWYDILQPSMNTYLPLITEEEKKERYRIHTLEHYKDYYEKNKEKINEYRKEYREKNKEKAKEYRNKNREKINEQRRNNKKNNVLNI